MIPTLDAAEAAVPHDRPGRYIGRMATAEPRARMAYGEYLVGEAASERKHEYLAGEVYAMSGGTPEHGALAVAVSGELRAALRGRPCRVFSSDVRVRVRASGLATYPDVTVVRGKLELDDEDPDAVVNPTVIVELLSPSTEAYDRGDKARHYRQIDSLREYVLVSSASPRIEIHRRNAEGRWEIDEAGPDGRLALTSLGVELDVAAIYANPLPAA